MSYHNNKNKFRFSTERKPEVDLRKYYTIFFQTGLILALLLFIGLTKINIKTSDKQEITFSEQEIVEMEEIIQTKQQEQVPPPPRPPVPVEVPNDEIIEEVDIIIDAELDLTGEGFLPASRPPAEVEEEPEPEEDFFVIVEQMPELHGGIQSIQEKVKYPELALKANIQGRVVVQFIINEKGEVENPKVVRSIGGGCDEEAVRVVKEATFTPGMQRGRPVRVQYALPVTFIIRE